MPSEERDRKLRAAAWLLGLALVWVSPLTGSADEAFPTFEPFVASRMWSVAFGEPGEYRPPAEFAAVLDRVVRELKTPTVKPSPDTTRDGPLLVHGFDPRQRSGWPMLPAAMMQLEPLWSKETWSPDELMLADSVARLVAAIDSQIDVRFDLTADAENREKLRRLISWFEDQIRRPERYGYMIFTFDDGPWLGMNYRPAQPLTIVDEREISESHTIQLCRTPGDQWCLQGLADGDVQWTKVLTQVPETQFEFVGEAVTALGPYGYKIHMSFGEYTHIYLGDEGQFLFYFTSW